MKIVVMNKSVLCFFAAFFFASLLYGQQNHFIYIQSDDKQAFAVSVNAAEYNSSDVGYVIVPKLSASQYNLKISFPGNKYPEQNFVCQLNNSDAGYALKNYGEKGWGLFNFQTLELVLAGSAVLPDAEKADTTKNVFGEMLSDVVDDSTLTKNMTKERQPEKKPVVGELAVQKEADAKVAGNAATQSVVPDVLVPAAIAVPVVSDKEKKNNAKPDNKPGIVKISDVETGQNREVVFSIGDKGKTDTIRILIPIIDSAKNSSSVANVKIVANDSAAKDQLSVADEQSKTAVAAENKADGGVKNPFYVPASEATMVAVDAKSPEKPVGDQIANGDTAEKAKSVKEEQPVAKNADTKGCKKIFSDNDFDKVKHKMFVETNDDKMIEIGRKSFQGKCVTTTQVKNLAILFPSDEGRLKFFKAAFPFTLDAAAYSALRNQLIDPQYKKQFDQYFAK